MLTITSCSWLSYWHRRAGATERTATISRQKQCSGEQRHQTSQEAKKSVPGDRDRNILEKTLPSLGTTSLLCRGDDATQLQGDESGDEVIRGRRRQEGQEIVGLYTLETAASRIPRSLVGCYPSRWFRFFVAAPTVGAWTLVCRSRTPHLLDRLRECLR